MYLKIEKKNTEYIDITCKICDFVAVRVQPFGQIDKLRCPKCGVCYSEQEYFSNHKAEEPTTSRKYVKWGCSHCKCYGFTWATANYPKVCPNCGVGGLSFYRRRTAPNGECSTIWPPVRGLTRPGIVMNLPKKVVRCNVCNKKNEYLINKPTVCSRCGENVLGI